MRDPEFFEAVSRGEFLQLVLTDAREQRQADVDNLAGLTPNELADLAQAQDVPHDDPTGDVCGLTDLDVEVDW